jgi:hypothetical protein
MMLQAILCSLSVSLLPPVPADSAAWQVRPGVARIHTSITPPGTAGSVPVVIEVKAEHAEKLVPQMLAALRSGAAESGDHADRLLQKLDNLQRQLDAIESRLAFLKAPTRQAPTLQIPAPFRLSEEPFPLPRPWCQSVIPDLGDLHLWLERVLFNADRPLLSFLGEHVEKEQEQRRREAVEQLLRTLIEINQPAHIRFRGAGDFDHEEGTPFFFRVLR